MRTFRNTLYILATVLLLSFTSFVEAADVEIIPSPDASCDQYFDHGYIYAGQGGTTLTDKIRNTYSNKPFIYFQKDEMAPTLELYRTNIMDFQQPVFRHPSGFFGVCGNNTWCQSSAGEAYVGVPANSSAPWWETSQFLGVSKVHNDRINPSDIPNIRKKMFIIRYKLKGYYKTDTGLTPAFNGGIHTECQQVGVHWCGDGVLDSDKGETCDDGQDNGKPGKCSTDCKGTVPNAPVCGDGNVDPGEECDDGNTNDNDSCNNQCKKNPICGNGIVEEGEECDDGNTNNNDSCNNQCKTNPICGNGIVEEGEECDDGNTNDNDACNNQCKTPNKKCDTLIVSKANIQVGESVDASCTTIPVGLDTTISCGGGTGGGAGPTTCTYNAAGTYTLSCDITPNFSPSIPCTATVNVEEGTGNYCGDGIVQTPNDNGVNEECEPSDPSTYDPNTEICTSSCQKEPKQNGEYIDLAIKKYIESNDAQTAISQNTNDTFDYVIKVQNIGTKMVTSTTTVQDTLPNGVEFNGNPAGSNWNCNQSGKQITCTTGQDVAAGAYFTEIRIPVKVTATSGTVTNHATVYNPDEDPTRSCLPNNQKPSVTATSCPQDGNNEDPAVFTVDDTVGELSIKKYAVDLDGNRRDGQNGNDALELDPGEEFYYEYKVQSTGNHTDVTITDTFPHQVEVLSFDAGGWNCRQGTKQINGNTHPTVICTRATLAAGTHTVRVKVKLKDSTTTTANLRNIAYICSDETGPYVNSNGERSCDPDCLDPNDPACNPGDPGECSTLPSDPNYDPACIAPRSGVDLALKKYIESNDAQTAISKDTDETFDYVIKVQNVGTKEVTGKTTVQDTLPSGVEKNGSITGTDWSCNTNGSKITCVSYRSVDKNEYFPDIRIPVKVTATSGTISNYATVHNPNENDDNACYDDNRMPNGNETSCPEDSNNIDPARFKIPSSTDGLYVAAKCLTPTSKVCVSYNSLSACENDSDRTEPCRNGDTDGYNQCNNVDRYQNVQADCGDTVWNPSCGNGIIDGTDEECDTGGDTTWCVDCKIKMPTNPGENPIEFWLTVPKLTNARIGASYAFPNRIKFNKYAIVVGKGTNVFTLADTVGFGIKPTHPTPIKISLDKEFCLQSQSPVFAGNAKSCTTLGEARSQYGNAFDTFGNYGVLGRGDYLVPNGTYQIQVGNTTVDAPRYETRQANSTNEVKMFKGAGIYDGTTLRDSFVIKDNATRNTQGKVEFAAQSANDPNTYNGIVEFKVQVSSVLLGTAGAPVNRRVSDFINTTPDQFIRDYLRSLEGQTSILGSVTPSNPSGNTGRNTNTLTTRPLNLYISHTGNKTIDEMSDLNSIRYNGNSRIYALKGDLTVNCKSGKKYFEMSGVKTVIVQGNIIFNCNTQYKANDYGASWAWIAQGGNISINNGTNGYKALTRLEGVYAAIRENSNGGDLNGQQGESTSTILRIVGTLYGNAKPLFDSRTYVRGNGRYDTLTTGTILSYSNRALRNTPPLLTQYINHYNLTRVTQ